MSASEFSADDLKTKLDVIRGERGYRSSVPYWELVERMADVANLGDGATGSTVGVEKTLAGLSVTAAREFYTRYYHPNNALLVISGRFKEARALELAQRYFGPLAATAEPLALPTPNGVIQDGERSVVLRSPSPTAFVAVRYHGVPWAHPDATALSATARTLIRPPGGALYRALVQTGLATSVEGAASMSADGGASFVAEVAAGQSAEKVRDRLIEVVEGFRSVDPADVSRFVNELSGDFDRQLRRGVFAAQLFTRYAEQGDWRLFFVDRARLRSLRAADITAGAQPCCCPPRIPRPSAWRHQTRPRSRR